MFSFWGRPRVVGEACLWLGKSGLFDQYIGEDEQGRDITRPPRWKLYLLLYGLEEKLKHDYALKGATLVDAPPGDGGEERP